MRQCPLAVKQDRFSAFRLECPRGHVELTANTQDGGTMKLAFRIAKYCLLGLCTGAVGGSLLGYLSVRGARSGSSWFNDRQWRELVIIGNAILTGLEGLLAGLTLGIIVIVIGIIRAHRPSPFG